MNERIQTYWQWFQNDWRRQLGALFVVLLAVAILKDTTKSPSSPTSNSAPMEIDQYTPLGHSLVPLQLLNQDSLLPLMGPTAVVNLYRPNDNHLVAAQVKVVRAPQSPDTLVAVVPEPLVASIARSHDQLVGVLKNPAHQHGTNFVYQKGAAQRKIHYGQDSK